MFAEGAHGSEFLEVHADGFFRIRGDFGFEE